MRVERTQAGVRALARAARGAGRTIGLVPTMGALHDGHLALVRAARFGNDTVIASVFVNPLQFGASEDLGAYPRDEGRDLRLLEGAGTDVVFAPSMEEMYPPGRQVTVCAGPLGRVLEGAERPGHFDGVCTVVSKLLNLAGPDRAYFGRKDAQQVAVVRSLVADLSYGVEIVECPTVRAPDGLALSSRNAYLSAGDRGRATILWRALVAGREAIDRGADSDEAERVMRAEFAREPEVELGYARAVDPDTFDAPRDGRRVLLVVAARMGGTRLIDNLLVEKGR